MTDHDSAPDAREAWTTPSLEILDITATQVDFGAGADGGAIDLSAS
ncbi:MAG TPA: hypothetical protein VK116_16400 [Planctomycetota bacterium]|nr:hypothetical protein [Planctomycetota bacterium]